ncbi:pentatricopeptide repeat-containing protein At4g02750-like [Selaginella moellendorffii]|uniref:pentatricopeptide repeat-containing protein At4g02750-like n=1 Tax=Selaginella moellendorffii TaxID=88036 RepID=UPI000D1D101B|nr:pentatricopeptide repeat-containing protein At4g02750-like [Selaginella moellendorffii]|eukprot:XP_024545259.1 pentatricopeptide repeat-containing protein At4g02750-like [Selaginella moellendorffii]
MAHKEPFHSHSLLCYNSVLQGFLHCNMHDRARSLRDNAAERSGDLDNDDPWLLARTGDSRFAPPRARHHLCQCSIGRFRPKRAYGLRKGSDRKHGTNLSSWNLLLQAYVQNGHIDAAKGVFESIPERSPASHKLMVQAYAHIPGVEYAWTSSPSGDVVLTTAVCVAYAQAGHLERSMAVFQRPQQPTAVAWTAMLTSLAYSGDRARALWLLHAVKIQGICLDAVVFKSVLIACVHIGVLRLAIEQFVSMSFDFGLGPGKEHYRCVLNILARVGQLELA